MSELKTLKDIDGHPTEWGHLVERNDLKQEAIKDIKYLRAWKEQGTIKLLPWITTTDFENTGLNAIIEYIKWKFNITEEDLKGGLENDKNI